MVMLVEHLIIQHQMKQKLLILLILIFFGNAQHFGDLTAEIKLLVVLVQLVVYAGGNRPANNIIEYVTIAAGGNAIDFVIVTEMCNMVLA